MDKTKGVCVVLNRSITYKHDSKGNALIAIKGIQAWNAYHR